MLPELAPFHIRDAILKFIPSTVLADLKILSIRYYSTCETRWAVARGSTRPNPQRPERNYYCFDILPYAHDLQRGILDSLPCSFEPRLGIAECDYTNDFLMKAQGAVYFDSDIASPQDPRRKNKLEQWSTWSMDLGANDESARRGGSR